MSAFEELLEVFISNRECDRKTDSRPERVPATDPVPECEHVLGVDSKLAHGSSIGRECHKVLRDGAGVSTCMFKEPRPRSAGVGNRLLSGECFARDDEQRRLGVNLFERLGDVGPINVRHKVQLQVAFRIGLESLCDHDGAEITTADADIDDRLDRLPRKAFPLPGPDSVGEFSDVVEHALDFVHARLLDGEVVEVAQGDVQHGAIFGCVDVFSGEHLVPRLLDTGFASEGEEFGQDFLIDEILGEIGKDGHRRAICRVVSLAVGVEAIRIARKEVLEHDLLVSRVIEFLEVLPGGVVCTD